MNTPAIELDVTHETTYRYTDRVSESHHVACLQPLELPAQSVLAYQLMIEPEAAQRTEHRDAFGNLRVMFAHDTPYEHLTVRAHSRVRVRAPDIDRDAASLAWETQRDQLRYSAGAPFIPESEFSFASPYVPMHAELADYAALSLTPGRGLLDGAIDLMQRIYADFSYAPDATDVDTPLLEAFVQRAGVCQDLAHVMIGALRAAGLAARYVSGYLLTDPPPGQARMVGADASHAWVSVWCGPAGWVDLDPTNNVLPSTAHVTLAIGRDYGDVAPLRGVIRGAGKDILDVAVTVAPVTHGGMGRMQTLAVQDPNRP
jgi:transglutaminase-like putative cysteine protease